MRRHTASLALLLAVGLTSVACSPDDPANDAPDESGAAHQVVEAQESGDDQFEGGGQSTSALDGYPNSGSPAQSAGDELMGPPAPALDDQVSVAAYPGGSSTPDPGSLQWPGSSSWTSATLTPTLRYGWAWDYPTVTAEAPTATSAWQLASEVTSTPWPTPTDAATPTPDPFMAAGPPVRLQVPSIGVDAFIEQVGLTSDRSMDAPKGWQNVGWFLHGFRPGETGNSVIAGHLDTNTGGPAVFWELNQMRPGDEVFVTYENGNRYAFVVDGSELYDADAQGATIEKIFGSSQTSDLNLVTCDGAWDHGRATYSKRLVVFSRLLPDKTVLVSDPGIIE